MNPEDIARMIMEMEELDKCPYCNNKYAAVTVDKISCPNKECRNYDEKYAEALAEVVAPTIKITDYYNDDNFYDMDWHAITSFINRGKVENYRAIYVPYKIGPYTMADHPLEGENGEEFAEILLWWRGPDTITDEVLKRIFVDWLLKDNPE